MTFCKSFATCHFVTTSPLSKQQCFWPVAKIFMKCQQLVACCLSQLPGVAKCDMYN